MKKIISLLSLSLVIFTSASAQHITPRYGTAPNQNRTFSAVGLFLYQFSDTSSATSVTKPDTILIAPNSYHTDYILTLNDSCVLSFYTLGNSYLGDNFTLTIENTSGTNHYVKLLGYSGLATGWDVNTAGGTKISPTSATVFTMQFWFDGVLWRELSRSQN
jgi:hypothetical protein